MSSKIAVVGCGYWGKNLVRNFRELDALAMVCDATRNGIKLAEELAPGIQLVENFDEVLSSDVQGVVIATPSETHFNLANQALEAGKDVFVEKPLAINYQERRLSCRTGSSPEENSNGWPCAGISSCVCEVDEVD